MTEPRLRDLKDNDDPQALQEAMEEFKRIRKLPAEYFDVNLIDWDRVMTRYCPHRSESETMLQWTAHQHPHINNQPWSEEESKKLHRLVEQQGLGRWREIARLLHTVTTSVLQHTCHQSSLIPRDDWHISASWNGTDVIPQQKRK